MKAITKIINNMVDGIEYVAPKLKIADMQMDIICISGKTEDEDDYEVMDI